MPTEYKQCLSTAHRVLDGTPYFELSKSNRNVKRWRLADNRDSLVYKASHVNHPVNIWLRECTENYDLLYTLYLECLKEYTYRYDKSHGAGLNADILATPPHNLKSLGSPTPVPKVMSKFPECMSQSTPVLAYQMLYREAKAEFATWKRRDTPEWFLKQVA
jgi:hypothetical protein